MTRKGLNDSNRDGQRMAENCEFLYLAESQRNKTSQWSINSTGTNSVGFEVGAQTWTTCWHPNAQCGHSSDVWAGSKPHRSGPYCLIWMSRGGGPYLQGSRYEPHSMEPRFNYFLKLLMLFMALCTSNILSLLISSIACFYSMLGCEFNLINESV